MTGKTSRNKGKKGEREFLNLLGELLGRNLDRNLDQWNRGGCDCVSVENWAIEVKRCEALALGQWWEQATEQAQALKRQPALAYRRNRKPWRVVVPLSAISAELPGDCTAELSIEGFAGLIQRRSLVGEPCEFNFMGKWEEGVVVGIEDEAPRRFPYYQVLVHGYSVGIPPVHFRLKSQSDDRAAN